MQENDVRELLLRHGVNFARNATIIGTLKPSVAAHANGMGAFMHLMREHVLHFNSTGVAIVPVSEVNGRLSEDIVVVIPNEHIDQLWMSVRRAHLELTIVTPDGDIVYKVRRRVLGAPWHKENLAFLLLNAISEG